MRESGHALTTAILAAGFSVRFGSPKALARLHGESLLHRTARIVRAYLAAPLIVIAPPRSHRMQRELRHFDVRIVINDARAEGLASSVRCALRAARYSSAVLILPTDLPRLSGRELQRLVRCWRGAPRRIAGRKIAPGIGTPLILPKHWFDRATRLSGDRGVRSLLESWPCSDLRGVDMPSAALDIDVLEDLARARRGAA